MSSPTERAAEHFRAAAFAAERGDFAGVREEVRAAGEEIREARALERETPHADPRSWREP